MQLALAFQLSQPNPRLFEFVILLPFGLLLLLVLFLAQLGVDSLVVWLVFFLG